ncbi:4'-phosphopantetheinyl transferase family protein [Zhihengliuella salsuginis]|uniref:4'-phosphopantetheinyl transferase n=1 Tax=Zhihengliuella salsuginis TaxID=578222 RepID=A0ABQ3GJQ1_9MICC|nr:hypothetical protein [Zhihengliuella salsuginis]GHD07142.1 hypothetical protein GCM10008096_17600 [Zhihengliuella salsuginis]
MPHPPVTLIAVPLSFAAQLPPAWLTPAERDRAAAYDDGAPRRRFLAGRLGVRFAIAAHLGRREVMGDPGRVVITGLCPRCGSAAHGRPVAFVDDEPLELSLSYSRGDIAQGAAGDSGWLLVGTGPAEVMLGVDVCAPIDAWDGIFDPRQESVLRLLPEALRAREAARRWAVIEARGKASGHGIVPAPNHDPRATDPDAEPAALEDELDPAAGTVGEWAGALGTLGVKIVATGTDAERAALTQLRAAVVLQRPTGG